jgi:gliding motility-associated-like protein
VTVNDIEVPVITCPADITVNNDLGICGAIVSYANPIGADNCSGLVITMTSGLADGAEFPVGITTVTYRAEDVSGNFAECGFTVTVIDNEQPVIVCPANQIETAEASCEFILGNYTGLLAATDNCTITNNLVVIQTPAAGTLVTGTTAISITVSDEVNNISTCAFDVIVEDTASPVITDCVANQSISLDANCEAVVADYTGEITVTDNCTSTTSLIITQSPALGTVFSAHDTVILVTVTVEDEAGNTTSCSFDVTLLDETFPAMSCPADQVLSSDASCEAVLPDYTVLGTYTDNCSVLTDLTITQSPVVGTIVTGTTVVTIAVTDAAGNMTDCTFDVALMDDAEPSITCIADQTLNSIIACGASLPDYRGMVTVADNCSAVENIVITQNPIAGTIVSGTNTVIFTVEDESGNTTTCDFQVEVVDVINPQLIQCAQSETLSVDDNCEVVLGDYTAAVTPIDNCTAQADIILVQTPIAGTIFSGNGTVILVNIEATDEAGNSITCVFEITLEDSIDPSVDCPADKVLYTNSDCEYVIEDFTSESVVMDNCSASADIVITQSPAPGTVIGGENATQLITLTATDLAGNSSNCEFTITLTDDMTPEITCGEDITVFGDAVCQYSLEDYTSNAVATDNCDNDVVITQSPSVGTLITGHGATQVVILTATDNFGNQTMCEFVLTLVDNTDPEITCIDDQIIEATSSCTAVLPNYLSQIVTSDNCIATTLVQTPEPGTMLPQGNTSVVMSVTDIGGNMQSCSFNVKVLDVTPPVLICPIDIEVGNDIGECGAIVEYALPTATDNCAVLSVFLSGGIASGEAFPIGDTAIEVTAEDTSGNFTTCTFVVQVIDTEDPILICPENQTVEADAHCMGMVGDYESMLGIADNCSSTFIVTQFPAPGTMIEGEQLVSFTVIDESGNSVMCGLTVEVVDTTAPLLECQEDIVQEESVVYYSLPVVTDNCQVELILAEGLASGDEFPHGITPVTYVARDAFGNADTCSFNVLINSAPMGMNDSIIIESHLESILYNVLGNDSDPDGDIVLLTDAWTSSDDTDVWIDEDGTIDYQVYGDYCGLDTVTYLLCDGYGACSEAFFVVEVECFDGVVVPEGFSPNGDGVNDFLYIEGILHFPNSKIQIFNRWGREVYQSVGYQNDWDAISKTGLDLGNGKLSEGSYFILVDLGDGSIPTKSYIYLRY